VFHAEQRIARFDRFRRHGYHVRGWVFGWEINCIAGHELSGGSSSRRFLDFSTGLRQVRVDRRRSAAPRTGYRAGLKQRAGGSRRFISFPSRHSSFNSQDDAMRSARGAYRGFGAVSARRVSARTSKEREWAWATLARQRRIPVIEIHLLNTTSRQNVRAAFPIRASFRLGAADRFRAPLESSPRRWKLAGCFRRRPRRNPRSRRRMLCPPRPA
jgi:hypothetical protein